MKVIQFLIIFFASMIISTYCYMITQVYHQYISFHFYLHFVKMYPQTILICLMISYIISYTIVNLNKLYSRRYSYLIFVSVVIFFTGYNFFTQFSQLYYGLIILGIIMFYLNFSKKVVFSFLHSIFCFFIVLIYVGIEYQVWDYFQLYKETKDNTFYENYYIDPRNSEIIEPQQKKNLIIISLESMEFTFANLDKNYITELSKLAEDNISFTNYKNGYAMDNTQTSTIATFCGIPSSYVVHFTTNANTLFSSMSKICPNAYSISQILKNYGYTLAQFQGSDNMFANNKIFLELHGFDIIEGLNELKIHPLCEKTIHGWHISDSNLFDILKDKVTFLSQKQPFFLYCNTNDTHSAIQETEQTVSKDFQQTSKATFDFVQWIQEQDFGANTVIIIVGDHLRMGQLFREITNRTIYNVFINSQATPPSKDRTFWAMDLCPTILEALGFKLKNPHLGLGVSLFSSEPTLLESMGQEKLTKELKKNNELYNSLWQ